MELRKTELEVSSSVRGRLLDGRLELTGGRCVIAGSLFVQPQADGDVRHIGQFVAQALEQSVGFRQLAGGRKVQCAQILSKVSDSILGIDMRIAADRLCRSAQVSE